MSTLAVYTGAFMISLTFIGSPRADCRVGRGSPALASQRSGSCSRQPTTCGRLACLSLPGGSGANTPGIAVGDLRPTPGALAREVGDDGRMPRAIDLNADLGESFGAYTMGDDAALLDVVTSASVACGF